MLCTQTNVMLGRREGLLTEGDELWGLKNEPVHNYSGKDRILTT